MLLKINWDKIVTTMKLRMNIQINFKALLLILKHKLLISIVCIQLNQPRSIWAGAEHNL